MKQYPTISRDVIKGTSFYVFDKIDGSNIRAEWTPKKGFHKFGSRKQLIDEGHFLGESISLVKSLEAAMTPALKDFRCEQATCYFEFSGPGSFAGNHIKEEPHTVHLLDVDLYKRGFVDPKDFLKAFEGIVPTPAMLYHGNITADLETQIRNGTLPGMTFEGVVCKAAAYKKWSLPVMFKIKNQAWIDKVHATYGHDKYLLEMVL